jgi:hypothetical protein
MLMRVPKLVREDVDQRLSPVGQHQLPTLVLSVRGTTPRAGGNYFFLSIRVRILGRDPLRYRPRTVPKRVAMEISGHRMRSIFDHYNIVSERDKQDALRRTHEYMGSASKKRGVAVMLKAGGQ